MNEYIGIQSTTSHLRFHVDWITAEGVATPELAATWASLQILVGDDCVTHVEDREAGSLRRTIFVPTYPLAEWIAYAWWFLIGDARPAADLDQARWGANFGLNPRRRHNMRAAGDGMAWPNAAIVPEGSTTVIRWWGDRGSRPHGTVRFVGDGLARIDSDEMRRVLSSFVESTLVRLEECGLHDTSLHREWRALTEQDAEEREFCMAAARLGLDPYSDTIDRYEAGIVHAAETLPRHLLEDFLDSSTPHLLEQSTRWIEAAANFVESSNGAGSRTSDLRVSIDASVPLRPWEVGYRRARAVRERLSLSNDETFNPRSWLAVTERPLDDRGVYGLGGRSPTGTEMLVMREGMTEASARFQEARALWHFTTANNDTFLVTSANRDRQKAERAFAAELLAPAEGIRGLLEDTGGDVTDDVAAHFNVNSSLIRYQIENQLDRS